MTRNPAADLTAVEGGFRLRLDLPGVGPDQLDLQVHGDELTLSAEGAGATWTRSFRLADDLDGDAIEASLERGVLTVQLPLRAETQPRRIAVH